MQLSLGVNAPDPSKKKIELRPYQREATEAVKQFVAQQVLRQLIVLPTGTGKTICFSVLADWILGKNKKVLVLAHRDELLQQAQEKMSWVIGEQFVSQIEMSEQWADPKADVIVASVQTIGREGSKRIQRFDPKEFGLIIIDEAHHATAGTYQNILDYFIGKRKDVLLVGVTATPNRSDEESLTGVFDKVVYQRTMIDMAREKWLVPAVSYRISSNTDLSRVKTTAGDYNLKDLAQAVNNEERNTLIVETYLRKFRDQQALVFATDLDHVRRLTEQLQAAGVKAEGVTGDLPRDERRRITEDFKSKRLDVVINYGIFTEGFDYEALGLIIMARPTQSSLLLTQIVGRANRLYEGKTKAEVIEIVDYHSEKTVTVASLFSFRRDFDCESHDFLECVNKAEEIQREFPNFNPYNTKNWTEMLARYEYLVQKKKQPVPFAGQPGAGIPRTAREDVYFEDKPECDFFENRYQFTYVGMERLVLLFKTETNRYKAEIFRSALGGWIGQIWIKTVDASKYTPAELEYQTMHQHQLDAVKNIECYILSDFPELDVLLNVNSKWKEVARSQPCSDKQWAIIERFKLTTLPRPMVSKFQASQLLNRHFSKGAVT